ncbi:MAG: hypothetical protein M3365_01980, partial [Gemmatimonadota bacterium]|nr:hypothetical protein [Gemmatimonadota bacterium]
MIETTERFLRDIADRIGVEAVDEVRLFPPLRQSGMETGVAVVAAIPLPPEPKHAPITVHRHTVFTARYRHTLKGPDRGRWEMEVQAEADAPLVTLDAVVRGVTKRAGEQFEPEKLSAS